MIWEKDGYRITDAREDLDLGVVHGFLRESYWAKGVPREIVERSVRNSLCFGVYHGARQVGFARLVTDRATFAYLADVFVVPEYRKKGLSKWLIATILTHPEVQGLRRWLLATADAHGLYAQNGFVPLPKPDRWMEINVPEIYTRGKEA